jgi:hypothetical protein
MLETLIAAVMLVALIIYALMGGADYGTPPSLEQTSQPQTTLMNWRCSLNPPNRLGLVLVVPQA